MKAGKQTTLCDEASVSGIGVHSGSPVTLTLHPADAGAGIVFLRTGLPGRSDCEIRADVRAVTATEFATVLGDDDGPLCATAEHVLAALAGLGVDNAVVEVDGPEVPIMDGSAEAFVAAIDHAGIRSLDAPRRFLKVLKPVRVTQGRSVGEILPNSRGLRLEVDIDFDHPMIGRQRCALDLSPASFRRELARLCRDEDSSSDARSPRKDSQQKSSRRSEGLQSAAVGRSKKPRETVRLNGAGEYRANSQEIVRYV